MEYPDSENNKKRDKVIALITTVVVHGLLMICFVFMGLTYQVPPPPEYGIEVDMGGGGGGGGGGSEGDGTRSGGVAVSIPPPSLENDNILTQNNELTASVNTVKNTTVPPKQPPTQTIPTEHVQPVVTPVKPTVDPNALFTKRNPTQGSGDNGSREKGKGIGNGIGDGNGDGIGNGIGGGEGGGQGGGHGKGIGPGNGDGSFFLNNRPVAVKAFPASKNNLQGIVIVEFRADRNGNVIYAKAGLKNTTINDLQIWAECEKAAYRSKFKAKPDADAEERGTITYKFVIQ